ncbi:MAG: HPr family phosphocarrier protein, partial [Candidatus Omnitrophica bacterium]|nr:HPr family phosphocarrier protein [Candidatus Omnitrophota bacterium]
SEKATLVTELVLVSLILPLLGFVYYILLLYLYHQHKNKGVGKPVIAMKLRIFITSFAITGYLVNIILAGYQATKELIQGQAHLWRLTTHYGHEWEVGMKKVLGIKVADFWENIKMFARLFVLFVVPFVIMLTTGMFDVIGERAILSYDFLRGILGVGLLAVFVYSSTYLLSYIRSESPARAKEDGFGLTEVTFVTAAIVICAIIMLLLDFELKTVGGASIFVGAASTVVAYLMFNTGEKKKAPILLTTSPPSPPVFPNKNLYGDPIELKLSPEFGDIEGITFYMVRRVNPEIRGDVLKLYEESRIWRRGSEERIKVVERCLNSDMCKVFMAWSGSRRKFIGCILGSKQSEIDGEVKKIKKVPPEGTKKGRVLTPIKSSDEQFKEKMEAIKEEEEVREKESIFYVVGRFTDPDFTGKKITIVLNTLMKRHIKTAGYRDPFPLNWEEENCFDAPGHFLTSKEARSAGLMAGAAGLIVSGISVFFARHFLSDPTFLNFGFTGLGFAAGVYLGVAALRYFFLGRATYNKMIEAGFTAAEARTLPIALFNIPYHKHEDELLDPRVPDGMKFELLEGISKGKLDGKQIKAFLDLLKEKPKAARLIMIHERYKKHVVGLLAILPGIDKLLFPVSWWMLMLHHPKSGARHAAVDILGILGDKAAIKPLLESLSDPEWIVRWIAAESLKRLGASKDEIFAGYIKALSNNNFYVRYDTIYSLAKLDIDRAMHYLEKMLEDPNHSVRYAAYYVFLNALNHGFLIGHVDRATRINMRIGEKLGLSEKLLNLLREASLFHDVGAGIRGLYYDEFNGLQKILVDEAKKKDTNIRSIKQAVNWLIEKEATDEKLAVVPQVIKGRYRLFRNGFGKILGGRNLSAIEEEICRSIFDVPSNSLRILEEKGVNISKDLEVLIKYHNDYKTFWNDIKTFEGELTVSKDEMALLISILVLADIFEHGNNKYTMEEQRGKSIESFSQTIPFIQKVFGDNRIRDNSPLDALTNLLANKDKVILDAIAEGRKSQGELMPGDLAFIAAQPQSPPETASQSYLDEVDENSITTDKRMPRDAAHQNGMRHSSVQVLLVTSNGKWILQRRADKVEHDVDISASGHVDAGENSLNAAIRETEEEMGIKISADRFVKIENPRHPKGLFAKEGSEDYDKEPGYDASGVFRYKGRDKLNCEICHLYIVKVTETEADRIKEIIRKRTAKPVMSIYTYDPERLLDEVARAPKNFSSGITQYFKDTKLSDEILAQIKAKSEASLHPQAPPQARQFQALLDPNKAGVRPYYNADKFIVDGLEFNKDSSGVAELQKHLREDDNRLGIITEDIPSVGMVKFEIDSKLKELCANHGVPVHRLIQKAITDSINIRGPDAFKGIDKSRPITIALLDSSESPIEDHRRNSFIGINKIIFEKVIPSLPKEKQKDVLEVILAVGITHELRHEAGIDDENVITEEDKRVTLAELDPSIRKTAIGSIDIISALELITAESLYIDSLRGHLSVAPQSSKEAPSVSLADKYEEVPHSRFMRFLNWARRLLISITNPTHKRAISKLAHFTASHDTEAFNLRQIDNKFVLIATRQRDAAGERIEGLINSIPGVAFSYKKRLDDIPASRNRRISVVIYCYEIDRPSRIELISKIVESGDMNYRGDATMPHYSTSGLMTQLLTKKYEIQPPSDDAIANLCAKITFKDSVQKAYDRVNTAVEGMGSDSILALPAIKSLHKTLFEKFKPDIYVDAKGGFPSLYEAIKACISEVEEGLNETKNKIQEHEKKDLNEEEAAKLNFNRNIRDNLMMCDNAYRQFWFYLLNPEAKNYQEEFTELRALDVINRDTPIILFADLLEPLQFDYIVKNYNIQGIITASATLTSHWVIYAKNNNIPIVIVEMCNSEEFSDAVSKAFDIAAEDGIQNRSIINKIAIMRSDAAASGEVIMAPSLATIKAVKEGVLREIAYDKFVALKARGPSNDVNLGYTGVKARLLANADSIEEVKEAMKYGAAGIGLFRTEYLFTDENIFERDEKGVTTNRVVREYLDAFFTNDSTREEKRAILKDKLKEYFKEVGKVVGEKRPVKVRMIDFKPDKRTLLHDALQRRGFNVNELEGVWFYTESELGKDILQLELSAILEAYLEGARNLEILFPMVSNEKHVDSLIKNRKSVLNKARREIGSRGNKKGRDINEIDFTLDAIRIGIMLETDEALFNIRKLLAVDEIDFYSIGTNDFSGYIMARALGKDAPLNRNDPRYKEYLSRLQPAVLKGITKIIWFVLNLNRKKSKKGTLRNKELCICGEMASWYDFEAFFVKKIAKFGVKDGEVPINLSMSANRIPYVEVFLSNITKSDYPGKVSTFLEHGKDGYGSVPVDYIVSKIVKKVLDRIYSSAEVRNIYNALKGGLYQKEEEDLRQPPDEERTLWTLELLERLEGKIDIIPVPAEHSVIKEDVEEKPEARVLTKEAKDVASQEVKPVILASGPSKKMPFELKVIGSLGFHMRAIQVVVDFCSERDGYSVSIKGIDATNIMRLMVLGAITGTVLPVEVKGPDPKGFIDEMVKLIDPIAEEENKEKGKNHEVRIFALVSEGEVNPVQDMTPIKPSGIILVAAVSAAVIGLILCLVGLKPVTAESALVSLGIAVAFFIYEAGRHIEIRLDTYNYKYGYKDGRRSLSERMGSEKKLPSGWYPFEDLILENLKHKLGIPPDVKIEPLREDDKGKIGMLEFLRLFTKSPPKIATCDRTTSTIYIAIPLLSARYREYLERVLLHEYAHLEGEDELGATLSENGLFNLRLIYNLISLLATRLLKFGKVFVSVQKVQFVVGITKNINLEEGIKKGVIETLKRNVTAIMGENVDFVEAEDGAEFIEMLQKKGLPGVFIDESLLGSSFDFPEGEAMAIIVNEVKLERALLRQILERIKESLPKTAAIDIDDYFAQKGYDELRRAAAGYIEPMKGMASRIR